MSKLKVSQRYIFKIHTARLRSAKWDLKLTLSDARKNDEMISIGENQMLRWIDELNGLTDTEERYAELKRRKNALRKQPVTKANRSEMKRIDDELDKLLFKPDYIHLVIDKDKDLKRACKGFRVNGIKYVRLLGTSGGVKTSTIVFVNERFASILRVRIDNGRRPDAMLVPAKFEAYRALTCSGTTPVSTPKGILVVEDSKTMFKEDVLYLTDENDGEPELRLWKGFDVELDASDGCGMMLPSLAARWSDELGLGYLMSACNTRFSWEKGVLFTFDFVEFADKVAGTRMVRDAWGNEVDISTVEVVLTTSMLKLWNSYDSIEHYMRCCEENHYRFGIAKISPQELENKRATNYQFLQPLDLKDEQIDQLIQPTISEIRDVLSGDYRKTLLFLGGSRMTEETVMKMDPYIQALMVEPRLFRDGYIRRKVYKMIRKRIDDAKIGVIDVHANYSILGGDLYALCQSIFGLPVTGLLKAGELYNRYWLDASAEEVACFRAPMSTKENIRKMQVANGEDVQYWFRYIRTCTLLNAFDTTMQALNGCDFDGDIMFITDNPVILQAVVPTKTLYCAQKSALKKVVTEADLVQSNIDGFGNEVGRVTNWVTSMYEVQARFAPESEEYKVLAYRIQSGQQYQQNAIDHTKGIICKPMPRYWHDPMALQRPEDEDPEAMALYELNKQIIADRKPYFMRYIYPNLMHDYNTYIKNTNTKCMREFRISIDELLAIPEEDRSEDQRSFVKYFYKRMPVGISDCLMNKLCRKVEEAFADPIVIKEVEDFDYSIMKSGVGYTHEQFVAVTKLFEEYSNCVRRNAVVIERRTNSSFDVGDYKVSIVQRFVREANKVCPNADVLRDVVLDVCYRKSSSKQFVWEIVGRDIVNGLLANSGGVLRFPIEDPDGDIEYGGNRYSLFRMEVGSIE